ncbi:TAXI family TRAP transporter solute-binding subunit [Cobetia sp. L2A1]|uniref:TAXI family TRAP transporter solute-binding subunit n=1 Tax=Cobetia sp. L2A1 TaxID=2686360 RepID=UPI00131D951D|nr:TAXI family TRAP transporter solute-binding subunit [Cobetia sp. L2A1]
MKSFNKASTRTLTAALLSLAILSSAQAATLNVGTNQQGSLFYSMGTALSKVMADKSGKQYRVSPYAGSSTYLPLINAGRVSFGFANGSEALFAYQGSENFSRGANDKLRLVGVMLASQASFAVATESDIHSIDDLKDKRLPSGYNSGRTFHYYSNAALATGGLTIDDTQKVPSPNFVTAIEALEEGRVDAALVTLNVGQGKQAMATMSKGWHYLSLDDSQAARDAVSESLPSARIVSLSPSDNATGVVEDPTHMIEVDFYLVTSADVDDETVSELVKTLHANKTALANAYGVFKRFDPETMVGDSKVPYHPGAIKAYKEMGLWPEE